MTEREIEGTPIEDVHPHLAMLSKSENDEIRGVLLSIYYDI